MARITTLIALAAMLALTIPAAAGAQGTTVPPGQSEADQYFETVPDGKGNKSLDNSKEPSEVLSDEQIAELEALGEDGVAAAQLAAATSPDGGKGGSAGGSGGTGGAGAAAAGTQGRPSAPPAMGSVGCSG